MCRAWSVFAVVSVTLVGCDLLGEGVDVAGVIGSQYVSLEFDEGSGLGSTLVAEAEVTPERFLPNVQERVGRPATSVDLLRVRLEAGTGATGVTAWSEVFSGPLTVTIEPANGSPLTVAMATLVSGLGAIEGEVTSSRESLDTLPDIAAGRFSVKVSGESARTSGASFTLPVRAELEFVYF